MLVKHKKEALHRKASFVILYAVERTRTSTGIHPLPPQDSVSAIPPLPRGEIKHKTLFEVNIHYYKCTFPKCKGVDLRIFVGPFLLTIFSEC